MNHTIRLTIVIIFILLFLPKKACLAQRDYTVEHFDIDNGLPSSLVNCILKDRFGYLWIGTDDGLCKFDGYQFKLYLQGTGANQIIFCMIEDHSGNLWVGTPRGLDKYNRINDSFTQYILPIDTTNLKTSYEAPGIQTICENKNGNFWIGTRSALYNFNMKKGIYTLIKDKSGEQNKLSGKYIGVIYQDKTGNVWIGTGTYLRSDGGLSLFDPSSGIIKQFVHDPSNPKSLEQNWVTSIYQDKSDNLWIGTNEGLDKFDFKNQNFIHFKHDAQNPNSLSSNDIKTISEDDNGNLLIGTW